jgi:hypothetical protein
MKLKYTIVLLSLATPLAAETDCLQDKNETLYEIISCLNQRGIENAKAITKKAVEIKALTDLTKKQREEIKTQQNLIQAQQENIKTLTEQLKKKLDVNGSIRGNNLHFLRCGGRYKCTPRMCLDLCIKKGLRMATYDEVYAWASTGKNHCAHMWMLHSQHPNKVFMSYPMYNNMTSSGCGSLNTGNIPRMVGINTFDWNSNRKYDCACAGIK